MKIEKFHNKKENIHRFRARFQLNGRDFRVVADTRKKLLELVDEIRAQIHRGKYDLPVTKPSVTVRRMIDEFIKTLDLELKNHRRRKTILLDFVESLPADYTANKLETADIKAYVEDCRRKSNLKPWSVHSLLTTISSALNRAPGIVKELGAWRPPKIPWVKVPSTGAGRFITDEEREKLLDALHAPRQKIPFKSKTGKTSARLEQLRDVETRHELAVMFEIALNTGMRWGEIIVLEWRFVDLKNAVVRLPKEITKNGQARDIYLSDRAYSILEERSSEAKTVWVFPNSDGTNHRKYYSKPLRTVARRIGLAYGQEVLDGFTPHSTRHTAGTLLVRLSDLKTAGEILGHTDKRMTLLYTHTNDEQKRAAAHRVGRALNGKKQSQNGSGRSGK